MDNKYSKLAKNTVIFAIGNFGSKVLTFLIVPLYTYVLTTEEYGKIDLFTTTAGLILPLVTLSIQEAMLRFVMGKEISSKVAINNCLLVFVGGSFLSLLSYPIYHIVFGNSDLFISFIVFLTLNSFTQIFSQYLRAIGNTIAFTINGILVTAVTLLSNVVLVLVLRWGMNGYIYSLILAQTISAVYIIYKAEIIKNISLIEVDYSILQDMLKYCIPLIPNSLMWWLMSGGDKYIIHYVLGDSANGLYSLAMKIPTLISTVYSLFHQAWQMSAIEESNESDEKSLYENVFKATTALLVFLVSGVVLCIKPLYLYIMGENFRTAWEYVPILSVGTIFSCYGSFFGVVYVSKKNTKQAFSTTLLGAIVNIAFNCILVFPMGLQGVAIGTCIGYLVVALIRGRDTCRSIGMEIDGRRTVLTLSIVVIQSVLTIIVQSLFVYIVGVLCLIMLTLIYRKEFISMFQLFAKKVIK